VRCFLGSSAARARPLGLVSAFARRCQGSDANQSEDHDTCINHVHVLVQLNNVKRAAECELVAKGRYDADRLAPGVAHAASGSTARHRLRRTGAKRAAIAHPARRRERRAPSTPTTTASRHRLATPSQVRTAMQAAAREAPV